MFYPSISLTLLLPDGLRPAIELSLHCFSVEMRWKQDFSAACKLKAQGIAIHGFDESVSLPLISAVAKDTLKAEAPVAKSALDSDNDAEDNESVSTNSLHGFGGIVGADALSALETHLIERHGKAREALLASGGSRGAGDNEGSGHGRNAWPFSTTPAPITTPEDEVAGEIEGTGTAGSLKARASRLRASRRAMVGVSVATAGAPPPSSPESATDSSHTPSRNSELRMRRAMLREIGGVPQSPHTPASHTSHALDVESTPPPSQAQVRSAHGPGEPRLNRVASQRRSVRARLQAAAHQRAAAQPRIAAASRVRAA